MEPLTLLQPEHVANAVRDLRIKLGTRAELIRRSGLTVAKLCNLEKGRKPSDRELHIISELVAHHGITIDESQAPVTRDDVRDDVHDDTQDGTGDNAHEQLELPLSTETTQASTTTTIVYESPNDVDETHQLVITSPTASTRGDKTTTPTYAGDGVRRISNSEIQAFKRCRRKWWLTWHRGLSPRVERLTGVRDIGNRIHRALQGWYVPDGEPRVDPRDGLERALVDDLTRITRFVGNGDMSPSELDKLEKSASLERAMVEGYVEWLEETGADENLSVIASETYVEAPLYELDAGGSVMIIGKIDTRVRRRNDNVRLFLDHKTVGDFTGPSRIVHMSEQMLHYHLLEWLTTGENESRCDGAIYNMIRRVKRTGNAVPPFFERLEVRHTRHELESFKTKTIGTIRDMLSVEAHLNQIRSYTTNTKFTDSHNYTVYPTAGSDCTWACSMFSVCPMFDDGSRAEAMLAQHYVETDPLTYYRNDMTVEETDVKV